MPTYDYECPDCGGFDAFRSLARRNHPPDPPPSAARPPRVLVAAPRLSPTAPAPRRAIEANEPPAHEPRSSRDLVGGYGRLRHPAGWGCCSTGIRSATVRSPSGAKAFPTKRPWMISH